MGAHNFGYFFREGLSNLFRHGFMSFASVGVTVACLLLTGTFALAALNVRDNLEGLEEENEILAFVDESYTEKQARALEARLLAVPNVAAARFISRGEALDRFVREHPEEDLFQDLEPQDFRDRYSLRLDNLEHLSETVEQIQQVPGVDGVNYYEEFAGGVVAMRNVLSVAGLALISILLAVSVFILSNTIRLTTYDRREEIAVMRMVGATNAFIRWPFVCEGFLMGLLGALIAFFLQWGFYAALTGWIARNDRLQLFEVIPFGDVWLPVAGIFLAIGLLIGVGGSLSAIRKFLEV